MKSGREIGFREFSKAMTPPPSLPVPPSRPPPPFAPEAFTVLNGRLCCN